MQLSPNNGNSAGSPPTMPAEALLRRAYQEARAHWPELNVTFEDFSDHLERLGYGRELPAQLEGLYLCIACAHGCPSACKQLEARYFPALRGFVSKLDPRPDAVDDLLQQIRYRLLVGPEPRIRAYRGEGSLDGWLRRVAHTVALDSIRVRVGRERLLQRLRHDSACMGQLQASPPPLPDEHLQRKGYEQIVRCALQQSLRTLPNELRQLLGHYYVGGLSIDQLGTLYAVNRSTAARRILRSVLMIRRSLRKELSRLLGTAAALEWESSTAAFHPNWDADVAGWLRAPAGAA
jgi:RNA polymerase sigma-70 factor